jgi:hypothetical protein
MEQLDLTTVYTAMGICHASYVDCLLGRSGWNNLTSPLSTQQWVFVMLRVMLLVVMLTVC